MNEDRSGFSLRGIIPPLVTPLRKDGSLDDEGLEKMIEHCIGGGVHGLFVLGTTGEGPSLSYSMRRHVVRKTCDGVRGRIPVLVGITDSAFAQSVALEEDSRRAGASAVVVAPPPYFATGQAELLEYLERLAAACRLPILLYNMPSHTKVMIKPSTAVQAALIEGIVGLKDSSCDMVYFHIVKRLLEGFSRFSLLIGPEELLGEAVIFGAHGGVCGGANLYPELYVALYKAARKGDLESVRELHEKVIDISRSLYTVGTHDSSAIKGLKCALSLKGLCAPYMAEPFHHFEERERTIVRDRMVALALL